MEDICLFTIQTYFPSVLKDKITLMIQVYFIITERIKYLSYNEILASSYFWRTYTGAELDYVEEINGELYGLRNKIQKGKTKGS